MAGHWAGKTAAETGHPSSLACGYPWAGHCGERVEPGHFERGKEAQTEREKRRWVCEIIVGDLH